MPPRRSPALAWLLAASVILVACDRRARLASRDADDGSARAPRPPAGTMDAAAGTNQEEEMEDAQKPELTQAQRAMVETWDKHTAAEFETANIDSTMATMTGDPHVNHVPVLTGGVGREAVRRFYTTYFIGRHPEDTRVQLISRTVGTDRIVDELIHTFTHDIEMPWILPGVPPTGKEVHLPVVAIVQFEDGKIAHEHIYWDQASVLAQIGLLDESDLPIAGVRAARKLRDPSLPSNELIERTR